jgi:hypothetical protein
MGRPAEQIEALQARVRELEGRCRALGERLVLADEALDACEDAKGRSTFSAWEVAGEKVRAYRGRVPPADAPPVLVAGDEGRAAWFAEIGLKPPSSDEARAAGEPEDEAPTP